MIRNVLKYYLETPKETEPHAVSCQMLVYETIKAVWIGDGRLILWTASGRKFTAPIEYPEEFKMTYEAAPTERPIRIKL